MFPHQPQGSYEKILVDRIAAAGLIARLRPDQPVDLLLAVGDALLASPLLVVEIPVQHPEWLALSAAFAARFGDHLLVGVGGIGTVEQGITALATGAQFLTTTRYSTELHQYANRCGALYIPPATATAALPALAAMAVTSVTMSATLLQAQPVNAAMGSENHPAIIATAVTEDTIHTCAAAGALAIAVGDLLFPTTAWSMPTMIRTARHLRQRWEMGN